MQIINFTEFVNEEWSLKKQKSLDAACWWMIDGNVVKISIIFNNDQIACAYAGVNGFENYSKHYFKPCSKEDNQNIQKVLKSHIYSVEAIDETFVYFLRRDNKILPLEYNIISTRPYYINDVKKIKIK